MCISKIKKFCLIGPHHKIYSYSSLFPGEKLADRLMNHIYNDSSLLETTLSLPRLWRHNFYNGVAGSQGVIDQAPSVLILPLDFGLAGGQVKSKQTDRLRYLEARYLKYFGGVSPVTLNEATPTS